MGIAKPPDRNVLYLAVDRQHGVLNRRRSLLVGSRCGCRGGMALEIDLLGGSIRSVVTTGERDREHH